MEFQGSCGYFKGSQEDSRRPLRGAVGIHGVSWGSQKGTGTFQGFSRSFKMGFERFKGSRGDLDGVSRSFFEVFEGS